MTSKYALEVDGKQVAAWEGQIYNDRALPIAARGYGLSRLDYKDVDNLGSVYWLDPSKQTTVRLLRVHE